jgi:uncharacterized membrane protein YraQ (UPF0718 family)
MRFAFVTAEGKISAMRAEPRRSAAPWGPLVLGVLVVGGLSYVKWGPYYHRAFLAASQHSIGASIVSGKLATPPPPSIGAALGYAWAYGRSIWQAMALGLLLGAGVQALVPRDWLVRVLGSMKFSRVALAGLISTAGMM